MFNFFPWEINTSIVAGVFLWSLALYIALDKFKESLIDRLSEWFAKFDRSAKNTPKIEEEESINGLFASLLSTIPFLLLGIICNWLVEVSFGKSWSISVGILMVISCAVYDLGRKDSQREM